MTTPEPPRLSPLWRDDPPKVGDFWLDARLTAGPSGVAFVAHDALHTSVMIVLLSEGASTDPAARDRFAGTVDKMHIDTVVARGGQGQDSGRLGHRVRKPEADDPVDPEGSPPAPWVALAYDGSPAAVAEADRILADVDLSRVAELGSPAGPAYRLHWIDRVRPGIARLWPLPWPGRHDRGGPLTILVSWLLMMLLAALAVLIAILIFQQAPPEQPPPPVPPTASSSASGSPPPSASPSPGSPSPGSASPSPASASPSPGSPSPSGGGSPSPNSRLWLGPA